MQLKPEQLPQHLSRPLAAVYIVSGDEPLQLTEAADAIRAAARAQGFSERIIFNIDKKFGWDSLATEAANLSLFSQKKLIELRMAQPRPGKVGGQALRDYVAQTDSDKLLLISTGRIDARTRQTQWCRALERAGVSVAVWPVEASRLPGWIGQRAARQGLSLDPEATRLLAERFEGNLFACAQELEKLGLRHGKNPIGVREVLGGGSEGARFDGFDLLEYSFAGNAARSLRVLNGLKEEGIEALLILGSLTWGIREMALFAGAMERGDPLERLLDRSPAWSRRRAAVQCVLGRHPRKQWWQMLRFAGQVDRSLKTGDHEKGWELLTRLSLMLCSLGVCRT